MDGSQTLADGPGKARARRDIALFFFSGHGVTLPDQSSFLLPVDFDDKDIEPTGHNKRPLSTS